MIEIYEGMKEVYAKIKDEFNLKIFGVVKITVYIEILNPPTEFEAPDPKKPKESRLLKSLNKIKKN